MITDTEIKIKGIQILTENLGKIEAERFVALIQREPFDYTKWQRELWKDKTVEELSREAMEFRRSRNARNNRADDEPRRTDLTDPPHGTSGK